MEIIVSKTSQNIVGTRAASEQGILSDAAVAKTHISPAKGQSIDQMAQQQAKAAIAEDASAQFEASSLETTELPVIRSGMPLTSKGQMLLMLGQFQAAVSNMDDAQRANILAIFVTQSEARIEKARAMSEQLDRLHGQFDTLESEFNAAQAVLDDANDAVNTAQRQLDAAQKSLTDLLEQLGVTDPDDPSVQDDPELMAAKKQVADAEKTLGRAQSDLTAARTTAAQKQDALQSVLNDINARTAEMNRAFGDVVIPPRGSSIPSNAAAQSENALTKTAIMIMLISEFILKMEEAAADKLQNDLALNRIQTKARQAEMQRKADEYAEQVKKAEDAQKMANCVGKILGGVAIALGALTTVFGGGGIALMAIGIALMVADPIVAAITGKSLTEMVMNPFMEHVFSPLMAILGDIITQVLDNTPFGLLLNAIDKATGANMMDTIHMVVTAAVTIAAIVAIALVAKSAAKFMIEKMTQAMTSAIMQSIKQAISQVLNKVIPQAVNNAARQGSVALSRGMQTVSKNVGKVTQEINKKLDNVSEKVSKNVMKILKTDDPEVVQRLGKVSLSRMEQLNNGIHVANTTTQSVMQVNISQMRLQATRAIVAFEAASMDITILRDFLNKILAGFEQDSQKVQSMTLSLSAMLSRHAETGKSVVRNFRA